MAETRLNSENVRRVFLNLINQIELLVREGKEAEKQLAYIAGATDMANAVIHAIKELGGA